MLAVKFYEMGRKLPSAIFKRGFQCDRDSRVPRIAAARFGAGDGTGIPASYPIPW